MIGLADINKSGEELTKEVQEGVAKASTQGGFEYRKSPMEIYSKVESIEKKMSKLRTFCDQFKTMKSEMAKLKSYSRVTTWNELLLAIPEAIYKMKFFDPQSAEVFKGWLDDYQSVATEDGLRDAIKDLEEVIDKLPESDKDLITNKLNSLFNEYHEAGGELFTVHNYKNVGVLPFSQTQTPATQEVVAAEPEVPTVVVPEPEVIEPPKTQTYSRRQSVHSEPQVTVSSESYGSRLKRLFGGRK